MNESEMLERLDCTRVEVHKRIKGYDREINFSLVAVAVFGHVLYTGYPGLAKTLLARTIAEVSGCSFNRIQLTPDLTPSDIRGTEVWRPKNQDFEVFRGPIFSHIVLADEINRTPPKVQSAFLDAMQEKTVTIGNHTIDLPRPFMVFATRNPIEQEGTYPLPEAQLDRFLFEIVFPYPEEDDEIAIAKQGNDELPSVQKLWTPEELVFLERFVSEKVRMPESIYRYIVKLIRTTRSFDPTSIELGASPRAGKMFVAASKAHAFVVRKSTAVIPEDIDDVADCILRHRLMMNPLKWNGMNSESEWKTLLKDIIRKAKESHVEN